jgi:uncharacterized membrane protein
MADYVVNRESFEFTYSAKQQKEVEKIRNKYVPKEESKMEKLIRLDKQAERPGTIASIVVGVLGSLILGDGMSCTLVWNSSIEIFIAGIVIGIVGMIVVGMAYPIYKKITKKERAKIAEEIIALSNELFV